LQLTSDPRIARGSAARFYLIRLQLNSGVRPQPRLLLKYKRVRDRSWVVPISLAIYWAAFATHVVVGGRTPGFAVLHEYSYPWTAVTKQLVELAGLTAWLGRLIWYASPTRPSRWIESAALFAILFLMADANIDLPGNDIAVAHFASVSVFVLVAGTIRGALQARINRPSSPPAV